MLYGKLKNVMLLFAVVGLVAGFTSCKEDDDNNNGQSELFVSTLSDPSVIKISEDFANNSDPDAASAYAQASVPKSQIQAYAGFMAVPAGATFNPGKVVGTWNWSYQGFTGQYLLEENNNQYEFEYTFTESGSVVYTFSGWEAKDGSEGSFEWNVDNNESFIIDWTKDASDTYTIDMNDYDGTTLDFRMVGTYNDDGSGNVTVYDDGSTVSYEASWNANGSGTATAYNTDGTVDQSWSW